MFTFHPKNKEINWKLIGAVTPERIQEENNTEELMEIMDMITYCNIDKERFQDINLIKLFKLSQLLNEYLMTKNKHVQERNNELEKSLSEVEYSMKDLKNNRLNQNNEYEDLKKENKLLKKTVYAYQMAHKLPNNQVSSYFKCEFCSKSFTSDSYLESHVKRRHADCLSEYYDSKGDYKSKRTDPLLDKITEVLSVMSTQLNATEAQVKELHIQQEREREEKNKFDLENKLIEERDKWFQKWDAMKKDIVNEIKEQESVKILDDKPEYEELRKEIYQLKKSLSLKSNSKLNDTRKYSASRSKSKTNELESLSSVNSNKHAVTVLSKSTSNPKFKPLVAHLQGKVKRDPAQIEAKSLDSISEEEQIEVDDEENEDEEERQDGKEPIRKTQNIEGTFENRPGWDDYEKILKNEIFSPIDSKPWVKTFFKHSESQVIDEKPVLLRDINKNIFGQEEFDLDASRPYFEDMKSYLSNQIDQIASQRKQKSKPSLQIDTSSSRYEQRDSGNASATQPRSSSPKRISWRDYRGDRPPSPSRVASPLKNMQDDEDWSDDEVESPVFKALSLNRPKLYQSFKNKDADARQIASSLTPSTPKANPFVVAKAATQFKGLLRKKEGVSSTPTDGVFNRGGSLLETVTEEPNIPRVFDRRTIHEKEHSVPPSNNFDQLFSKQPVKLTIQQQSNETKQSPQQSNETIQPLQQSSSSRHQKLQDNVKRVVVDEDKFESDVDEF